ncbi:MAG TPA: outer membrane beta-barrel protein [bacterium]|nr:outer membrane beta-barrel protein [bacterium]
MTIKSAFRLTLAAAVAILVAAAAAGALVRLGAGASAGFAFPAGAFDHDAKAAPGGSVRLYGNLFHWLTLEGGADLYLPFDAERDDGVGETHMTSYKVGLIYKVHMGVFMPFVAGGYAVFDERIKREKGWEDVASHGFYVGPGLEYYFTERFSAFGMLGYNRTFDNARTSDRDTQYVKLDFGLNYYYW